MRFLRRCVCQKCDEILTLEEIDEDLCSCCRRLAPVANFKEKSSCCLCGQSMLSEKGMCMDCRVRIWSFSSLTGLSSYRMKDGYWIASYKKDPRPRLVDLFVERLAFNKDEPGVLIPVPPHPQHRKVRGWDPVDFLAAAISRQTQWPLLKVLRRKNTDSQKTLSKAERFCNADSSYFWTGKSVGNQICWLLDDVVTTGATVQACSSILLKAGALDVRVLCLALH